MKNHNKAIRETPKQQFALGERHPWNKGLTKETDERVRKHAEKQKRIITNLWKQKSYRESQITAILNAGRPTCYEKELLHIIQNRNLPFSHPPYHKHHIYILSSLLLILTSEQKTILKLL